MNKIEARAIADAGLVHIAADPDLLMAMMQQSGADPAAIRDIAARPEFAVFILDFLLESDERLLAFAETQAIQPQRIQMARAILGGFDPF